MLSVELNEKEIRDISEAIDSPDTKQKLRRRLLAVKMAGSGARRDLICSTLDISAPTLCSYISLCRGGGLAALLEDRSYRPTSSALERESEIRELSESEPPSSAEQASAMLKSNFSLELSARRVRRVMRKLGMKFVKSGVLPGKGDAQMQLDFLEGPLDPRFERARAGEIRLFFGDGSHFIWGAQPGYSCCFDRIWTRSASGRKRYSALGAVDLVGENLHFVDTDGSVNAESVRSLLLDLRAAHPDDPICLVLDNARYNHARIVEELAEGLRVELLFLPPYSPNLNVIERLWKRVKSTCLKNRYHESFPGFCSCKETLESRTDEFIEKLRSLLTLNSQKLNC